MTSKPTCRLYVIAARDGRSAVVFRRGPSKWVLLLRWWLKSDKIEHGQWFKGMIFPQSADLSPDGELLVYHAQKYNHRLAEHSWTAISRPPFLTALKIWFGGYSLVGGGIFEDHMTVDLDLPDNDRRQGEGKADYARLTIMPPAPTAGKGSLLLSHRRRSRDGWRLISSDQPVIWQTTKRGHVWAKPSVPLLYEKLCPDRRGQLRSSRLRHDITEWQDWPNQHGMESYTLIDPQDRVLRTFAECDWADWQTNGDLLLGSRGCLYRLPHKHIDEVAGDPMQSAKLVADLGATEVDAKEAPAEALHWP